jgi:hypothetical protein
VLDSFLTYLGGPISKPKRERRGHLRAFYGYLTHPSWGTCVDQGVPEDEVRTTEHCRIERDSESRRAPYYLGVTHYSYGEGFY